MKKGLLIALCVVISVSVFQLLNGCEKETAENSLMVYCGAGIRNPMDEIGTLFSEKHGVSVEFNYAGSNTLLSQIQLVEKGDVYMPGATLYIEKADEKGLIGEMIKIAYHVPVIVVPRGNPGNIKDISDLAADGVKVALGDPKAAAIGKISVKLLEKNDLKERVEKNVVTKTATVNELVVYIAMGQADAGIIWEDVVRLAREKVDIIQIPAEKNIIKVIPIGTLKFSKNKELAGQFIRFVASDEGKSLFKKHGFLPWPDPSMKGIE